MDLTTLMRRLVGLGCYALGGVVTPYLLLFAGDLVVPVTVNGGAPVVLVEHPWAAAAVDVALLVLFGLQHSLMTLPAWRRWLARWLPAALERSAYIVATVVAVAVVVVLWQPIGGTVWRVDGVSADALGAGYWLGCALVYAAALWLDHAHLLGLRQAWGGAHTAEPSELRVTGPYRFVRHPLMTGLLLVFWCTPHLTWGQLVFAAGMTAYVVVGTLHEERRMVRLFGEAYRAYARLVPMLTPSLVPPLLRYRARRPVVERIVVRRPRLDFTPSGPSVWHADNVVATAMMNAYSVLFPPLERFMVDELRTALPDLRDGELARDVRDFVGQESLHAYEHARSLAYLEGLGYRVTWLARCYDGVTRWVLMPATRYLLRPQTGASGAISIFAGVEHWTAMLSELVLRRGYPLAYNPFVALFYWHAAEELEHKSVVADVLAHLGGSYPIRVLTFVAGTLAFLVLTTIGTIVFLAQIPALQGRGAIGWAVYPLRVAWDGASYLLVREKVLWHALWAILVYLVPLYRPDRRPTHDLVRRGLAASEATGGERIAAARVAGAR